MIGNAAVDLDRKRRVVRIGFDERAGPFRAADQVRGLHEIGRRQPQSTQFTNGLPECQMRVAGERRQKIPRRKHPVANPNLGRSSIDRPFSADNESIDIWLERLPFLTHGMVSSTAAPLGC